MRRGEIHAMDSPAHRQIDAAVRVRLVEAVHIEPSLEHPLAAAVVNPVRHQAREPVVHPASPLVPPGRDGWGGFDPEVLGGHYTNHHPAGPAVALAFAPGTSHPVLEGVEVAGLVGHGSLYKVSPLATTATPLMVGSIPGQSPEPVAWVNAPASGNRVFYTSLGQADDFAQPGFNRLLKNAIDWAVGRSASR